MMKAHNRFNYLRIFFLLFLFIAEHAPAGVVELEIEGAKRSIEIVILKDDGDYVDVASKNLMREQISSLDRYSIDPVFTVAKREIHSADSTNSGPISVEQFRDAMQRRFGMEKRPLLAITYINNDQVMSQIFDSLTIETIREAAQKAGFLEPMRRAKAAIISGKVGWIPVNSRNGTKYIRVVVLSEHGDTLEIVLRGNLQVSLFGGKDEAQPSLRIPKSKVLRLPTEESLLFDHLHADELSHTSANRMLARLRRKFHCTDAYIIPAHYLNDSVVLAAAFDGVFGSQETVMKNVEFFAGALRINVGDESATEALANVLADAEVLPKGPLGVRAVQAMIDRAIKKGVSLDIFHACSTWVAGIFWEKKKPK